jgi:TonB family protein
MTATSQWVSTFLLNSLWEITLIFGVAQMGSWIMGKTPARYRYRLWLGAIVAAVVLPLASAFEPARLLRFLFAPPAVDQHNFWFKTHATISSPAFALRSFWMYVLLGSYLAFVAYRLFQFVQAWRRVQQLWHGVQPSVVSSPVHLVFERCRQLLGAGTVLLCHSPLVRSPVTVGMHKSKILVPESFRHTATAEEWTSMLAHEMAHVRRKDFARNIACELFYLPVSFHPAARMMKSRLAGVREMACDELATRQCVDADMYVRSLLSLARKISELPSSDALAYHLGILDANILEERVMKLLQRNTLTEFWSRALLALALAALAALCIPASAYVVRVGEAKTNSAAVQTPAGEDSTIPRVGPGITAPRAIATPNPEYPQSARDAGTEGTLTLGCVIGTDGLVQDARVVKSLSPELDEAAVNAVRQWRFKPAMKSGKPIVVQVNVDVHFSLSSKAER